MMLTTKGNVPICYAPRWREVQFVSTSSQRILPSNVVGAWSRSYDSWIVNREPYHYTTEATNKMANSVESTVELLAAVVRILFCLSIHHFCFTFRRSSDKRDSPANDNQEIVDVDDLIGRIRHYVLVNSLRVSYVFMI